MEMAFHIHWLRRLIRMDSHKDSLLCSVCLSVSWRKFQVYHQPKVQQNRYTAIVLSAIHGYLPQLGCIAKDLIKIHSYDSLIPQMLGELRDPATNLCTTS